MRLGLSVLPRNKALARTRGRRPVSICLRISATLDWSMSLFASFHALNRYTGREVLDVLRKGPQSVSDIHAQIKVGSRASISQALAVLLEADMVSMRRQG